jgi:hypothetical protein
MTRRHAIRMGVGGVVLAALLFLYALSQTTLSYLVPGPEGIVRRTAIFQPALVASIVSGVALVGAFAALVWTVVREAPRWVWWVLVVLIAAGVVADIVVLTTSRPKF